jgi:hypothetical protein
MPDVLPARRQEREHVMAQLAACRRSVGIALAPCPRLVELRGHPADLSAIAAQLIGRRPTAGQTARIGCGWWRSSTPSRAQLLADEGHQAAFDTLLRQLAAARLDVAVSDLSGAHAALILAGPLAARLAACPAARLAQPLMVVCDGDDYRLLVVARERAADSRHVLLEAGRAAGAVAVGTRATELHRAARRIRTAQHAPTTSELFIHPTTTGAPAS